MAATPKSRGTPQYAVGQIVQVVPASNGSWDREVAETCRNQLARVKTLTNWEVKTGAWAYYVEFLHPDRLGELSDARHFLLDEWDLQPLLPLFEDAGSL